MTPRGFVFAVSGLAVLAGAGIAIIAVAFLGGGTDQPKTQAAVVASTATLAPATLTPTLESQALKAPTPTTIGAAVKPTLAPTVPRPTSTPRPPEAPEQGGGGGGGDGESEPTPTRTPKPALPDLVV